MPPQNPHSALAIPPTHSAKEPASKARRRLVHGDMIRQGVCLEFHDFSLASPLDWTGTFHAHSLEICLNLHGDATLRRGSKALSLQNNECAVMTVPTTRPATERTPLGRHCFYTLRFTREWLKDHLRNSLDRLKPEIRHFVLRPTRARAYIECFPLPTAMIPMRIDLIAPPVPEGARDAWYFGKIFEIIALTLYEPAKAGSPVEERNRHRVERARELIQRSIENPPALDALAREADCSPFHLSRMFKQALGISISDYQRAARMEAAAAHLRAGKSVGVTSELVGYRSVSAFINAFGTHHRTTPSHWAALWREDRTDQSGPN